MNWTLHCHMQYLCYYYSCHYSRTFSELHTQQAIGVNTLTAIKCVCMCVQESVCMCAVRREEDLFKSTCNISKEQATMDYSE